MFSKTQDKHLRNFLGYGKDSQQGLPSMQEPVFFGFHIFFDWYNISLKYDPEQVVTGLLLPPEDSDSAINYLLRRKKTQPAAALKKFIEILKDIEENKPWMFQSIEGLDAIFAAPKPGQTWRGSEIVLTVNCLETLDTRMGFLASLYNAAVYDRQWQRVNLPFNKRKFNCKIIVSEMRNIGKSTLKEEHPNALPSQADIDELKSGLEDLGFGEEVQSVTDWYDENIGDPLKDYAKEVKDWGKGIADDVKDWAKQNNIDLEKIGKSDIGKAATDFITSNIPPVFNGPTQNGPTQSNTGWTWLDQTKDKASQIKVTHLFEDLDKKMTFYVFDLYDCEFIFDDAPFLDSVSVNNFNEPATFKFQIKVGFPSYSHQFRFFNWVINDYYDSILVASSDKQIHREVTLDENYQYKDNNILHYEAKTKYRLDSFNPLNVEWDKEQKTEDLKKQSPADKGSTWDAIVDKYKSIEKIDDAISKLSGGKYKGITNEIKKEITKIKDDITKAKINFVSKNKKFLEALGKLDITDPFSILNTVKEGYDVYKKMNEKDSNADTPSEKLSYWEDSTKPSVKKAPKDFLYKIIRELNSEQKTNNRFWKNATQMDWKNIADEKPNSNNLQTSTPESSLDKSITKWEYLGRFKKPHPDDKNIFTGSIKGVRNISEKEKIAQTRLGLITSHDGFKNVRFSGNYLKDYENSEKRGELKIKYKTKRTVYDVPDNPSKIYTERPEFGWKRKDWKNIGLGLDKKEDIEDNSGKFNYLRKFKKRELKYKSGLLDFGYGERITKDGKKFVNIYTSDERKQLNKTSTIIPIKLEGAISKKDITKITLEGSNSDKSITPIKLEGTNSDKSITPIKLEGTNSDKSITPIKLEGSNSNKSITSIKLEGSNSNKSITSIKLEGSNSNKSITPIKLEGSNLDKSITPIKLEGSNLNKSITPIKLEESNLNKSITPIKLEESNLNKSITPIKLEGSNSDKSITSIKLEGFNSDKSITPIKLEGSNSDKNITSIKLKKSNSNKSITPIKLEGFNSDKSITSIKLEGFNSDKSITSIKLEGFNSDKSITPIKLEGTNSDKSITPIKLEGTNSDKSITPIKLEGAKPLKKIIPIKLISAGKLTKIQPKHLDLIKPSVRKKFL